MSDAVPHHRLSVDTTIGTLHLRAELELSAPWTVIFGPSGSGKSSLLKAACGLFPATFVRYDSDGRVWTNLTHRPTHLRQLAYAPQGALLFPHLTVRQNIDFASRVQHSAHVENLGPHSSLTEEALDLLSLLPLASRLPRALSGGERQRVNIARALAVPRPRLTLLDEPFAGIDRALRDQLLSRLAHHLAARQIPVLSVTHDIEEALLLNAEVIRLEGGTVTAQGTAGEVLAAERTRALRILAP